MDMWHVYVILELYTLYDYFKTSGIVTPANI